MNELKKTNYKAVWMLRVPAFPADKRKALAKVAKDHRQSIGAYVGNLLDEEIRKAEAREEKA